MVVMCDDDDDGDRTPDCWDPCSQLAEPALRTPMEMAGDSDNDDMAMAYLTWSIPAPTAEAVAGRS